MKIRYMQRAVFSTDDPSFPFIITYPSPLGAAEFSDIEQFLALWLKTQKRLSTLSDEGQWRSPADENAIRSSSAIRAFGRHLARGRARLLFAGSLQTIRLYIPTVKQGD